MRRPLGPDLLGFALLCAALTALMWASGALGTPGTMSPAAYAGAGACAGWVGLGDSK